MYEYYQGYTQSLHISSNKGLLMKTKTTLKYIAIYSVSTSSDIQLPNLKASKLKYPKYRPEYTDGLKPCAQLKSLFRDIRKLECESIYLLSILLLSSVKAGMFCSLSTLIMFSIWMTHEQNNDTFKPDPISRAVIGKFNDNQKVCQDNLLGCVCSS